MLSEKEVENIMSNETVCYDSNTDEWMIMNDDWIDKMCSAKKKLKI